LLPVNLAALWSCTSRPRALCVAGMPTLVAAEMAADLPFAPPPVLPLPVLEAAIAASLSSMAHSTAAPCCFAWRAATEEVAELLERSDDEEACE